MSITFNYWNKVAFVTGAGSGIGRATALAFAASGARVAAVGRSEEPLTETVRQIEAAGGEVIAISCDVANDTDVAAAVATTVKTFGRLDFAVNNAGVEQPTAPAVEIGLDEWDRQMRTNLGGVFNGLRHQIPELLKAGGGVIVNTGSGAAVKGIAGQAAYCAAKFGVVGLSKAAALDYADRNIRINVVSPGMIDTPMMDRFTGGTDEGRAKAIDQEPVGRAGRPEEIAATVLWLCSDEAAFTVGANIVVDGGQTV